MLKIENVEVVGWEAAIRGMRNPMNSWERSDSKFLDSYDNHDDMIDWHGIDSIHHSNKMLADPELFSNGIFLGPNDKDLMMRLNAGGSEHAKYRRMIAVYVDITAPFYWWKEMDTYMVGKVMNSCSTMHKIASKEFTPDDFSCEHFDDVCHYSPDDGYHSDLSIGIKEALYPEYTGGPYLTPYGVLGITIGMLNKAREKYLETKDKRFWWQMIQLLPSSYNQKRTLMLNYEVLSSIYRQRKGHKLDEWHKFREWIESLPYNELITGIVKSEEAVDAVD